MREKKESRPRKRFGPGRNNLLRAQEGRGKRFYNIWQVYSGRLCRDLILKSDAEFDHICLMEGDEAIAAYVPEPEPIIVSIAGEMSRTQFDARVHRYVGPVQLREVKHTFNPDNVREQQQFEAQRQIAEAAGFEYVRVSLEDLEKHRQLIKNWRRALSFLSACRSIALEPYCQEILRLFVPGVRISLGPLVAAAESNLSSVYVASALRLVQDGTLHSDLHERPLCAVSQFWLRETPNAQ
jgi:hypothetical protein